MQPMIDNSLCKGDMHAPDQEPLHTSAMDHGMGSRSAVWQASALSWLS